MSRESDEFLRMLGLSSDDVDTTADSMHQLCMKTLAEAMMDDDPAVRLSATSQYITLMIGPPITNLVVRGDAAMFDSAGDEGAEDDDTFH